MRKLLLLLTLVVSIFAVAQTDNYSTTAIVIRQSSDGTMTVMQVPNPHISHDVAGDVANTQPDKILLIEQVFQQPPASPFQTSQMVVFWTDQTDNDIWFFIGDDDPTLTGRFLAVTKSVTAVEGVVRDAIHNKL